MIRTAITPAAYEAIERTFALGTLAAKPQLNERGERLIWLEERRLEKLNSIRRPGESYSEAVIRVAALWEGYPTYKRRRLRNV
jgi:hypothetical protein